MCKPLSEGGKRCAAHTRPAYEAATFGTPEWDRAAAEYAATPSGRKKLTQHQTAAEQAGDVERAVALTHALSEGDRLSEAATAVRTALATESPDATPAERFIPIENSLRTIAEDLGYRRTLVRPNPGAQAFGTLVFQQGSNSTEVPYSLYPEGLALRFSVSDLNPDAPTSSWAEYERRAHWDDEAALAGLTRQVRDVLEIRRDTAAPESAMVAPATAAELEEAFKTIGVDLGYTQVRIKDVPEGFSRYVDFLRPRPAKSRRIRYYAHDGGWTVRIGGYYPRLANRAQARQGERELKVSASWANESDSIEALGVIKDLFAALG